MSITVFARSALGIAAALGLLALCTVLQHQVSRAAVAACSGPQLVTFLDTTESTTKSRIVDVACATARIRQLTPHKPVTVRLLPVNELRQQVVQVALAEAGAASEGAITTTLRLLGALGTSQSVLPAASSLSTLNNAAVYDYRAKTLYVRQGKAAFSPLDRAVIAHEFTHALQDQYFNLGGQMADSSGPLAHDSDAVLAREAVIEGDAYNTMLAYALSMSRQDQVLFNQALQRSAPDGSSFTDDRFGFPTAAGTSFVKYIMTAAAKGKSGAAAVTAALAAVNQALASPPRHTQEVLQPAMYVQRTWKNDMVAVPEVALGPQWQAVSSDVLGAFAIDDMFTQGKPASTTVQAAAQAAGAWVSDRWLVYQSGANTVLVWHAHFSSAAGAQAFERALLAYTGSRFHTTLNGAAPLNWNTTGFAMSLRDHSADVALAIGSNTGLQSTCAKSLQLLGFA